MDGGRCETAIASQASVSRLSCVTGRERPTLIRECANTLSNSLPKRRRKNRSNAPRFFTLFCSCSDVRRAIVVHCARARAGDGEIYTGQHTLHLRDSQGFTCVSSGSTASGKPVRKVSEEKFGILMKFVEVQPSICEENVHRPSVFADNMIMLLETLVTPTHFTLFSYFYLHKAWNGW